MTRSKHILALLVALVALVALAPAASAANRADGFRMGSVDPSKKKFFAAAPNPRASSLDPNPVRYGSFKRDRRHARSLPSKRRAAADLDRRHARVIGLHGTRIKF